jgi:hypothetical protein
MSLLSRSIMAQLERRYAGGIPSAAIVEVFCQAGTRFSEPTLRKYVQLGLLPKSERVGIRGPHRGSSGLYPVTIVRQINAIKAALDRGLTLDEVRFGSVALGGEVEHMQRVLRNVVCRFADALERRGQSGRHLRWRKKLRQQMRTLNRAMHALEKLAIEIGTLTTDMSDWSRPGLR